MTRWQHWTGEGIYLTSIFRIHTSCTCKLLSAQPSGETDPAFLSPSLLSTVTMVTGVILFYCEVSRKRHRLLVHTECPCHSAVAIFVVNAHLTLPQQPVLPTAEQLIIQRLISLACSLKHCSSSGFSFRREATRSDNILMFL